MAKRLVLAVWFLITFLYSCKDKKTINLETSIPKTSQFIPVTEYILGQIHELDSLPITPLLITTVNGHADSIWLKKDQLKNFTSPFTEPVIDSSHLSKLFKESSFLDQSINAFTYSYDPAIILPKDFNLQRWDVYVDPQKQTIQRIYLVKTIQSKDSGKITQQLTWKSGSSFKITNLSIYGKGQIKIKEQQVIWNFNR